jgi:hypothetical protein
MKFDVKTPGGGIVSVELKPAGSRRNTRDERVKVYEWTSNAFLGQHGDPFGTVEADDIHHAHALARDIVRGCLQRKYAYEEFHARREHDI